MKRIRLSAALIVAALVATAGLGAHSTQAAWTPIPSGHVVVSLQCANPPNPQCVQVNEYTPSGTFVRTLLDGSGGLQAPWGLAFDNAGNLYVADAGGINGGGNQIFKLDNRTGILSVLSNNQTLGDGSIYNGPEQLAFTPDFSELYVTDFECGCYPPFGPPGGLHLISPTTGKGLAFYPLPSSYGCFPGTCFQGESDGVALSGSNVYITNETQTQGIMRVNTTTGDIYQPSLIPNLPGGGIPYGLALDKNNQLWIADTTQVLVYGNLTGTPVLLKTIPAPPTDQHPYTGLAADGTGTSVYVPLFGLDQICRYSVVTFAQLGPCWSTVVPGGPPQAGIAPAGIAVRS